MNSIFFRIYGGVVLAVMLIGALAYGAAQLTNEHRAGEYRERMARGTFFLMARSLQRHESAEERQRWLLVLGRLLGSDIEIRTAEELTLTREERERLADGRVVMRLNENQGFADIIYGLPGEDGYLYTRMTRVGEQQARATALLVLDELGQHPREDWTRVLDELKTEFGFPIVRRKKEVLDLDREQMQRLERREVVLAFDESNRRSGSAVKVYAPIGNTGEVLVLGPVALFERWPVELLVVIGFAGLMGMALATYVLVRPLQARLRKLDLAVQELGSGNLEARAEVHGHDAVGQLASTFNGMTEHIRRLIESQREMTRAVSHELRTPVARLRFGLEMLAASDDAGARRQKLEELDHDIDQLDELIDEILTFARLEEGTPVLEFRPVDIPALMEQIQRELSPISGNVEIAVHTPNLSREECRAEGEERYLHRILQNLVTNAVRYADARVLVRYRVEDDSAVLEVEDDGPGIAEVDRERVFKPFARLDQSRHRGSGGYGLGLSIVQRIVEWHSGEISIGQSSMGGARFRVRWPLRRAGYHVLAGNKA